MQHQAGFRFIRMIAACLKVGFPLHGLKPIGHTKKQLRVAQAQFTQQGLKIIPAVSVEHH